MKTLKNLGKLICLSHTKCVGLNSMLFLIATLVMMSFSISVENGKTKCPHASKREARKLEKLNFGPNGSIPLQTQYCNCLSKTSSGEYKEFSAEVSGSTHSVVSLKAQSDIFEQIAALGGDIEGAVRQLKDYEALNPDQKSSVDRMIAASRNSFKGAVPTLVEDCINARKGTGTDVTVRFVMIVKKSDLNMMLKEKFHKSFGKQSLIDAKTIDEIIDSKTLKPE